MLKFPLPDIENTDVPLRPSTDEDLFLSTVTTDHSSHLVSLELLNRALRRGQQSIPYHYIPGNTCSLRLSPTYCQRVSENALLVEYIAGHRVTKIKNMCNIKFLISSTDIPNIE